MLAKALQSAALATQPLYIEDVFSTWLYTGNGSTQTITNGIDLAGEGGLVWIKSRGDTGNHILTDTFRGANSQLISSSTGAALSRTNAITAFNSNGFTIGSDGDVNWTVAKASWTFRKAPKFFDVVTYTGNGSNRTISHSLGSVPGCIIVKRTDTTADWQVYHRSLANTEYLVLNSTAAKATGTTRWNSTTPTSTEFSLGTDTTVNANGGTYVAYLFAHDAGGFGLSGSDNVISCGSFTTDASGNFSVNLGYEAQWVLVKSTDFVDSWYLIDVMRGMSQTSTNTLKPNTSGAETAYTQGYCVPTATGFASVAPGLFTGSKNFIYIAIRRGPMKTPTTGTSVFAPVTRTGTNANASITTNFPVDFGISRARTAAYSGYGAFDRLRGNVFSYTPLTDAEYSGSTYNVGLAYDSNTAMKVGADSNQSFINGYDPAGGYTGEYSSLFFRRAPGFFDVVCYTGTGSATTVAHNLGVVPELMIVKNRVNGTQRWRVYVSSLGATKYLELNTTNAEQTWVGMWNNTAPTATVFTVGSDQSVNESGSGHIAYLFATLPGVSKVGSYTGNGTSQTINCGFTTGARFVLIKRTDSAGDWYVWDSARGIVAGNDPYLLLNSTAAEVTSTDYIDTYSAGFEISSTAPAAINANGGTFIFLAIA